jgi:hypothetical protein
MAPKKNPKATGALSQDPPRSAGGRDPVEMDRYRRNQAIIKTAAVGSPEYNKALVGLERVGKMYGLNWQQWIPEQKTATAQEQAPAPAQAQEQAPVTPTQPLPPEFTDKLPEVPEAPPMTPPGAPPPPPGQPAPPPLLGDVQGAGYAGLNELMGRAVGQGAFKPGDFTAQMEQARNTVMQQFNRRNEEEFGRQNLQVQQQIAERGLDPNSEAAQALMRANSQRQDFARQEALNAAEQAAYGVQAQGFNQGVTTYQMPFENMQNFMPFYEGGVGMFQQGRALTQQERMAGIEAGYTGQQIAQQAKASKDLAEFEAAQKQMLMQMGFDEQKATDAINFEREKAKMRYAAKLAKQNSGGGGGGAAPQQELTAYEKMIEAMYAQGGSQSKQPSAGTSGVLGVAQGIGSGITQNINR